MNNNPAICPVCGKPIVKCYKITHDNDRHQNTAFCSKDCYKENKHELDEVWIHRLYSCMSI